MNSLKLKRTLAVGFVLCVVLVVALVPLVPHFFAILIIVNGVAWFLPFIFWTGLWPRRLTRQV